MSLPNWNGAQVCYRRAYRLLEWMGANGHVTRTGRGKRVQCHVSQDMTDLIDALNRGDESAIKATLLDPRWFDVAHAA
jgi:hypothetical protein